MNKKQLDKELFGRRINDDFSNIEELEEFFKVLKFEDNISEGYTKIKTLNTKMFEEHEINAMIKNIYGKGKRFNDTFLNTHGNGNIFFSINSFNTDMVGRKYDYSSLKNGRTVRYLSNKVENTSTFNCIVMDIDFKNENEYLKYKTDEELVQIIRNIKEPTYIIKSGHGCHIYYNIYNYKLNDTSRLEFSKDINSYKFCCKTIDKKFRLNNVYPDEAVTGRIEKIMRIPFTYNTKDIDNPKRTYILYKNLDIKMDLKQFYFKCKKVNKEAVSPNKKITTIKNTGYKVVSSNAVNYISNKPLPSDLTVPHETYNKRGSNYINYSIFLKNAVDDIKFLVQHKDYKKAGRRNMILFHLVGVLNDYNEQYENDKFDIEGLFEYINEYFKLPDEEVKSLLNRKVRCKTSKRYLFKLMGVNEIDETYMKSLMISEKEKERRRKILIKERNDKNSKKYNAIKSEKAKIKKQEKINYENELVSSLINDNSLREISKITGFSLGKVSNIANRIKAVK